MAKFGGKKIIAVLDEYRHPLANGEYGSVILFHTDGDIWRYSVAVDFVGNDKGGDWTSAYSVGTEEKARLNFRDEVEKINKRVESELALQQKSKVVKEQFRSLFWLELDNDPNQIVICKNFVKNAEPGKQWVWGQKKSRLAESFESAKTIFAWEILKLVKKKVKDSERIFSAEKNIVDQYEYLLLVELKDKKGGFAVFEDGVEDAFLGYFSHNEEKYARFVFESKKADVDEMLDKLETQRLYELKVEKLKNVELKVIGFTSYDNKAIAPMVCSAEQSFAWPVLAKFMKENGLKFSGNHHQNGDDGVPVFNNARKFTMSTRTWGGLMADAYGIKDMYGKRDMAYCKWAWSDYNDPVLPREKGIRVFEWGEEVEAENIEVNFDGLEVDTRPSYQELQRQFAKQGYFKMPRVMTPQQLLDEIDKNDGDE